MKSFSTLSYISPLAALLLLALPGRAQETSAPSLTLTAALQRAAENNPTLAAQRHHERAAAALIEQAGYRPNPTLDVSLENFAGTGRVQGVRSLETTVQASQIFERGGKREKRVALAGRDRDTAAREFAVHRSDVMATAATAYVEVLAAQQRLALAEEPLRLARETLASVDARVQAGAASSAESARARAAVASAQAEHARRQAALTAARATLAATWGGRAADVGALTDRIRLPDKLPAEEVFLAGLARHPRLELQQAVIAGRRASLDLAQAQAAQDVTAGGGIRFLREGSDAAFVAGVSVPLPVRHRNLGNIRAARENLTGAEAGVRGVEAELRAAFSAAWQDMQAAHATAVSLRRDALPATEEAYAIVRRAYAEGQLPLMDVFDAQRALIAIRGEILEAEAACALALTRAEALTAPTFPVSTQLFSTP